MPDSRAIATPADVLGFWFDELAPKQWFKKDAALDRDIAERFGATLAAGARCELWHWRESADAGWCDAEGRRGDAEGRRGDAEGRRGDAEGRLAEILVLDQFSRNVHRDTPGAFAQDPLALALAQEMIARGEDRHLPTAQRVFVYMPFMHSESLTIHDRALDLFDQPGMEPQVDFERRHRAIIERFGRYPHRNAILGRESTPAEVEFLRQPGSSF